MSAGVTWADSTVLFRSGFFFTTQTVFFCESYFTQKFQGQDSVRTWNLGSTLTSGNRATVKYPAVSSALLSEVALSGAWP